MQRSHAPPRDRFPRGPPAADGFGGNKPDAPVAAPPRSTAAVPRCSAGWGARVAPRESKPDGRPRRGEGGRDSAENRRWSVEGKWGPAQSHKQAPPPAPPPEPPPTTRKNHHPAEPPPEPPPSRTTTRTLTPVAHTNLSATRYVAPSDMYSQRDSFPNNVTYIDIRFKL